MIREKAIEYGTEWLKDEYLDAKDKEFIKIALEALKRESCGDCISRQAAKELYFKDGYIDFHKICEVPPVKPQYTEAEIQKMQELEQAEIQKAYELGKAEQLKLESKCEENER